MAPAITALSTMDEPDTGECRYLLFPPAGATVDSLRELARTRSGAEAWGVEFPGRGERSDVALPDSLEALAEQVTHELLLRWGPAVVERTVLAGFSMGAYVAVEVAARARAWCGVAPAGVIVVGAPAPGRRVRGRYRRVAEDALTAALARDGITADDTGQTAVELRTYAKTLLSNDLRLMGRYRYPDQNQVPCPLVALCGADDPGIITVDDATGAWRDWTTAPFQAWTVPGGHLSLLESGCGGEFWAWADLVASSVRQQEDGRDV